MNGQGGHKPNGPRPNGPPPPPDQRARFHLNALQGVDDKFIEDINKIIDTFKDNALVMDYVTGIVSLSIVLFSYKSNGIYRSIC